LYANTLTHQYALDDKIVITENQFTKQGFAGIGDILTTDVFVGFYGKEKNLVTGKRYRPLSLVTFAIEHDIFGLNPFISHLINMLLYLLTVIVLYRLMQQMFPDKKDNPWYFATPFIITMLYVAHPLHTEVIANIKGRDEILSLLGSLIALYYTFKWLDDPKSKYLLLSSLSIFLALFSKENAITFLFIIPVSVHFCTDHKLKRNLMALAPMLAITVLYLIIRFSLLGVPDATPATELMNNPFVHASTADKFATIFYTLGIYVKLMIFPHPLTHDYYPMQVPIIGWTDWRALLSLFIYCLMAYWALIGLKTKKPSFYGVLLYLASLSIVSNIVFPIGSFMNERFMYVPTIGFCIVLGIAFTFGIYKHIAFVGKNRTIVNGILILTLLGYSVKTISRNAVWKDDLTLSTTDVKISTNSAKANMSAGLSLVNQAQKENDPTKKRVITAEAIGYLNRSLKLYPVYIQPMLLMGNAYYEIEEYENSLVYFENCLRLQTAYSYAVNNIEHVGDICSKKQNPNLAVKAYLILENYGLGTSRVLMKLGQVYGRDLRDNSSALKYILKAQKLDPDNLDIPNKLGIIYSMIGQHQNAIDAFNEVLAKDPDNANTLLNLGITYQNMGNEELGNQYIQRAIEIDPALKQ